MFKAKVDFNEGRVKLTLGKKKEKAQKALDSQVLADSNFFCPQETSTLQKSGIANTVIGSGKVIWKTPYAKKQYYGINFDHTKGRNPNATAKWFASAKARYLKKWKELVDAIYRSNS